MVFYLKRFLPYRRGVGLFIVNDRQQIFVARRIDTPSSAWQMPQGGIEKNESPEQAVFREMQEEIGTRHGRIIGQSHHWHRYDLPRSLVRKVWGGQFRGQKQKWFAIRFLGTDQDINLHTNTPEFCDWRWAHVDELESLAVDFKRDTYRHVIKELWPMVLLDAQNPTPDHLG